MLRILTLVALVVRVAFLLAEPQTSPVADERTWTDWARIVADKAEFSPLGHKMIFHPPLYPYFLAVPYALLGTLEAAKWLQVVLSVLLVPAVGRVAALAFGTTAGVVAAGIAALYPELVWFAAHYWVENLFVVLLWWGFERLFVAARGEASAPAVVAGLLFGLSVLARETALYFLPVVAVWLCWRRGTTGLRQAALLVLAAVLTIAPWTYRNWLAFRAFVPVSTAGGQNLFQGNTRIPRDETYVMVDAVQGRIEQYRYARAMGLTAIRDRQPWWIFEKLRDEMPMFWEAESMALIHVKRGAYGAVGPAAAVAAAAVLLLPYLLVVSMFVVGLSRLRPSREAFLLLLFFGYYNFIHVVTHGFNRYRLPVMPVLFVIAAWGVAAWRERLPATPRGRLAAAAVAIVLVLSIAPSIVLQWRHCAYRVGAPCDAPPPFAGTAAGP